jgi:preprotein translocase subunit SecD
MKTLITRLFFLVLAWLALTYYVFPWKEYNINVPFSWKEYKLGLDLQGWVELDYRVDLSEAKAEKDYNREKERSIIEWLKAIIDKRVESLKINDSVILTSDYAWEKHIIVQIPLKGNTAMQDKENIEKAKKAIWKVVRIKFKQRNPNYTGTWSEPEWIPAKWKWSDWELHELDERYFVKSAVQFDQIWNPAIELVFNDEWKKIFWDLSTRLVWQEMAVFVGGEMLTHPVIREPILWWKAQITWNYSKKEALELSQNINTWVVPAPIYLTSEKSIDSKLWSNSLQKLIIAWAAWFLLIFIFLIYFYRLSGLVSSIALLMYIVIILAIVKSFWTVLTLASIAWLILSVGMAIDANILIFERIREEIQSWKDLVKASEIWFKKSWSAIWDSNITGLIVALILYIFWINMIKGFGLMLGIWIVVSLFSAMYISRVFVLLLAKARVKKKMFIWK